jgi:hypothetical protein
LLGGFKIDHQLEFSRLLDRNVHPLTRAPYRRLKKFFSHHGQVPAPTARSHSLAKFVRINLRLQPCSTLAHARHASLNASSPPTRLNPIHRLTRAPLISRLKENFFSPAGACSTKAEAQLLSVHGI